MRNCTEIYPSHKTYDPNSLMSLSFTICKDPVLIIPVALIVGFIIYLLLSCCSRSRYKSYGRMRN